MLTEAQVDTLQSYIAKAKTSNTKMFQNAGVLSKPKSTGGVVKPSNNQVVKPSNDQDVKPSNDQSMKPKAVKNPTGVPAKPKLIEAFDPMVLQEEFPTNSMGTSSSTSGTGPIDTFDPLMKIKAKNLLAKRKTVGHLGFVRSVKTI